jgi:hypothetical protein
MSTGLPDFVGTRDWVWPVGEILHFFGMAALIGTVGLVDARILGIGKGIPISALEKLVPIGVVGFLLNAGTGFVFIAGNPVGGPMEYLTNLAFQIKMALIVVAALNLLAFYVFGISRAADAVGPDGDAPTSAKIVAVVSIVIWFAVIVFGRLIMYNDTLLTTLGL